MDSGKNYFAQALGISPECVYVAKIVSDKTTALLSSWKGYTAVKISQKVVENDRLGELSSNLVFVFSFTESIWTNLIFPKNFRTPNTLKSITFDSPKNFQKDLGFELFMSEKSV